MDKGLTYFTGTLIVFLLALVYILIRNIYFYRKAEREYTIKNKEITSSQYELMENMERLMEKQEELKRSESRYRLIMESTTDIIWEGDLINNKRIFSGNLYDVLGYEPSELERLDAWFHIVHPEDVEFVREGIKRQVVEKIHFDSYEYRVRTKDGSYKWLRSNGRCEFDENGTAIAVFGSFTDITELKNQQQRIKRLAYYDSTTNLPNKIMLREAVTEEIEKSFKNASKFALIFLDLDNFKFVNDSYGHIVGDKLLNKVAHRLKELQTDNKLAFRLGGDEFSILLKDIKCKEQVEECSKTLLKTIVEPIYIDGNMFKITQSGGIVLYPENGGNFDELLKNADTAMYSSKEAGRGIYTFYESSMGFTVVEKTKIQTELHKALENNEFLLYYQPIINTGRGKIEGFEALIRWSHPRDGMIPPGKFISAAEENGTIIQLGKWVITNACKYAKAIYDSGFRNFYVSVNVSALQLVQKDFTDFVLDTIKQIGISPELLLIEITESILMESLDLAIESLNKLREINIKIALDDFGCGYSSLTYLRRLPINILKIDKSFIDDINMTDDMRSMVGPIILLAKQLGLKVIVEGVETEEQLYFLKMHGCDMFQGYLASKPVPEDRAKKMLEENYAQILL